RGDQPAREEPAGGRDAAPRAVGVVVRGGLAQQGPQPVQRRAAVRQEPCAAAARGQRLHQRVVAGADVWRRRGAVHSGAGPDGGDVGAFLADVCRAVRAGGGDCDADAAVRGGPRKMLQVLVGKGFLRRRRAGAGIRGRARKRGRALHGAAVDAARRGERGAEAGDAVPVPRVGGFQRAGAGGVAGGAEQQRALARQPGPRGGALLGRRGAVRHVHRGGLLSAALHGESDGARHRRRAPRPDHAGQQPRGAGPRAGDRVGAAQPARADGAAVRAVCVHLRLPAAVLHRQIPQQNVSGKNDILL
ncbi:hypothetical protein KL913_003389, partial [Ogataea haglerorum]